jgi:hypothetical protein
MTATIINKFAAAFMLMGLLVAGFSAILSTATVPANAQYGEYVRCENITNPVRKQQCNDRVQNIVDQRIDRIRQRTTRRIEQIMNSNAINKNALILSALNLQFWEIWNIFNVIFPLVS